MKTIPSLRTIVPLLVLALLGGGLVTAFTQDAPPANEGIRLNFKEAPLSEVLNYLSEAAGFAIIQDVEIGGLVTVVSHQPLSPDEAVDLLNSILLEKGYVAIRNDRILKIVNRDVAHTMYLPVHTGSDPEQIPRKDEMVTQIIPVRYADAMKLIENLSPLLGEKAKLTANESSNALVMTDTQSNVRRIAEIIRALDTSISSISTVRVFPLQYADATELADVITKLFQSDQAASNSRSSRGGAGAFFERFRMGGDRGGDRGRGGSSDEGESEARQAASRVVAVADERSNSVIVTAPDEFIPTIEQLVREIDANVTDETEVRVFALQNADAVDLAQVITGLFEDAENSAANVSGGGDGGRGSPFSRGQSQSSGNGTTSQRKLAQSKVVAVGDPRTNSLMVSAARETMMQVAELVGRLDASGSKRERVYVYPLEHADADNVATILRGMFDEDTTSTTQSQTANPLTTRSTTGASDGLNTSFGGTRSSQ